MHLVHTERIMMFFHGNGNSYPKPFLPTLTFIVTALILITAEDFQIGDSRRSNRSSTSFFLAVDTDQDDTIDFKELSDFVEKVIGGTQFDTPIEIELEASAMFKSLDLNDDRKISFKDVKEHWNKLECLLTSNEVAEWVKYAVQLPDHIAQAFKENAVTGFDFSELIINDGEALRIDLGIEKYFFRKKLVRLIKARMLGVGTVPQPIPNSSYNVESCSSVSFTWHKPNARGFPVHSYRIQRRAIAKEYGNFVFQQSSPNNSTFQIDSLGLNSTNTSLVPAKIFNENWKDVYVGADTEFVDTGLELSCAYIYRIQAWNAVGRSQWVILDISSSLKRLNCLKSREGSESQLSYGFNYATLLKYFDVFRKACSGLLNIINLLSYLVRCFFTFIAMAAALMRLKNGSTTSTGTVNLFPLFPYVWKSLNTLNAFCVKTIGTRLFPESLLTDVDSLQRAKQDKNISGGAVGVGGVHVFSNESGHLLPEDDDIDLKRTAMMFRKYASEKHILSLDRPKLCKAKSLADFRSVTKENEKDSLELRASTTVSLVGNILEDNEKELKEEKMESFWDDDNFCNVCEKKFKLFKRMKHHCARCTATFCHKHGRTPHARFTSCKFPGCCVCNHCLEAEKKSVMQK